MIERVSDSFFLLIRLEFNWHMALLCISKYILALFWLLPRFRLWFYGSFFTSFSFSLSIKYNWYYLELLMQQLWFLQNKEVMTSSEKLPYKNFFLNFFKKKYVMKNHGFCISSYTFSVKKKSLNHDTTHKHFFSSLWQPSSRDSFVYFSAQINLKSIKYIYHVMAMGWWLFFFIHNASHQSTSNIWVSFFMQIIIMSNDERVSGSEKGKEKNFRLQTKEFA